MKKEYFVVPYDYGFQHGSNIVPVTKEEYEQEKQKPYYERRGEYFNSYISALYYTQD